MKTEGKESRVKQAEGKETIAWGVMVWKWGTRWKSSDPSQLCDTGAHSESWDSKESFWRKARSSNWRVGTGMPLFCGVTSSCCPCALASYSNHLPTTFTSLSPYFRLLHSPLGGSQYQLSPHEWNCLLLLRLNFSSQPISVPNSIVLLLSFAVTGKG